MEENSKNEILVTKQNNINSINNIPDEYQELLEDNNKREKQRLINVFNELSNNLDKNEGNRIIDLYKSHTYEDYYNNKYIRKDNGCIFWFMTIFIFPLFVIINLVGIFLIIPIEDTLSKLLWSSIKCKLEIFCNQNEFEKQSSFFDYFLEEFSKEPLNFSLMMFWSFVGIKCLKTCGFRKTSFAFHFFNSLMILFIYNFDFNKVNNNKKYGYARILMILLLWFFTGFTCGSTTLLSQQILINYYSLIFSDEQKEIDIKEINEMKEEEEKNEEKENKEDKDEEYFINFENKILNKLKEKTNQMNINYENIGRKDLKNLLKQILKEEINKNKEDKSILMFTVKEIYKKLAISNNQKFQRNTSNKLKTKFDSYWIVAITTFVGYMIRYGISIFFSKIRDNNYEKNNEINNNKNYTNYTNFTDFFFHSNNETNETNYSDVAHDDKTLFLFIYIIYIFCIVISIILYTFFKCCIVLKKGKQIIENVKNTKSINNEGMISNQKKSKCELLHEYFCIHKIFFEIFNCIFYIETKKVDNSKCKIGCCSACGGIIKHYCNESICNIFSSEDNEINCCPCCKDYNKEDYDKKVQFFCYCYQEKGFFSWLDKFITNETQKKIVPFMFLYFISNLIIIGSEKKYKDKIENNKFSLQEKKSFILIFLEIFSLYILIMFLIKRLKGKVEFRKDSELSCLGKLIKNSNEITIELYAIIFFNSVSNLFFTAFLPLIEFLGASQDEKDNIYAPIFFRKFFIFELNYYCVNISSNEENKELLLSQSTLITIYLLLSDKVISIINWIFGDIFDINIYSIQNIFSYLVYIIFLLAYNLFKMKKKGVIEYFGGVCLCNCCWCNKRTSFSCCYCESCDSICSYRENCNFWICEFCND